MKKNVAGQNIGAQIVSATDGSAFTGSVTVYVTGDAGTQSVGSVGSGACTHKGNGYHTYAPAQAETNYDIIAFTFIGTGAVPVTVQIETSYPQTGDSYARIGAPAGASVSADVAAVKTDTAAILLDTGTDGVVIPQAQADKVWSTTARALTDKAGFTLASGTHTGAVIPTVTTITNDVGITQAGADKVWSSTTRTLTALGSSLVAEIWNALTSGMTTAGSIGKKLADWVLGSDSKVLLSNNAHTGATVPTVTTVTNAPADMALNSTVAKESTLNTKIGTALTYTAGIPDVHVATQANIDFGTLQKASLNAATPSVTVSDKTGFSLSSAGIQAIWDALTSTLTTIGSVGKLLADYVDTAISSRSTYAGGAVASVTAAVTVGTNNDKTGYSLSTAPPTAAEVRQEMDANSTQLAAIITDIGAITSTSGRVELVVPSQIIKATSGNKYIKCYVQLYDSSRLPFDSRDHDGGNYSTSAHYVLNDRVKPTTNNSGGYMFKMTTFLGTDSGGTAPDWSTAQSVEQTCTDGNGNTWTNIGTPGYDARSGVTALNNGCGIIAHDEANVNWPCYADDQGTLLHVVNQCSHHGAANQAQQITRESTGMYSFWINADDAETDRTIYFEVAWFDKARWENGFSTTTDHRRVIFQSQIITAVTLTLSVIEGSTVLAKETSVQTAITNIGNPLQVGSLDDIHTDLSNLPTLAQIEASTVLAKETSVTARPTNPLLTTDIRLDNLDASVTSRLASVDYITPITPGVKKNTALNNFEFPMFNSSDHVSLKSGLTITAERSIDGGSFASCANTVTEIGTTGIYKINLAASDLNGDIITFRFEATGSDARLVTIKTNS